MASSHHLYVTHNKTMHLHSVNSECSALVCFCCCFFKGLGREAQSSLIYGTLTLQLQNDSSPQCLSTFSNRKSQFQTPGAPDTKLCHRVNSHLTFTGNAEGLIHWRCHALSCGHYRCSAKDPTGRSYQGRCLPTSPSRSNAKQWLSRRTEDAHITSSSKESGVLVCSWNLMSDFI